jgi:repressor LexA
MPAFLVHHPLRVSNPACRALPEVPALGRIAAGPPLEAVEEKQRGELLELLTAPGRYALRVGDDSLCEAGILAGDFVIVQSQRQARDGDLVIGLLDREEVILKRIRYRADGQIRLLADHPAGEEITLPAARLQIQGRVVGQLRRYR